VHTSVLDPDYAGLVDPDPGRPKLSPPPKKRENFYFLKNSLLGLRLYLEPERLS
jgi:hypothetical protein